MVFVKVRETYDLHTVTGKITAIGIHTPGADIIKRNYPGLLMQCKAYRPVSANVTLACASVLPADPLQVSTTDGDISPEDLFNPILYKAVSNVGMSQIEARINSLLSDTAGANDLRGQTAVVDNDTVTNLADEFDLYYGMLSDTHQWKHAMPQQGLSMRGLKPLVYEMLYNVGDNMNDGRSNSFDAGNFSSPDADGNVKAVPTACFRGNGKPMPMLNTTSYTYTSGVANTAMSSGFNPPDSVFNCEQFVPAPLVYVGAIIVPPSRLHQLYYRMVVEWTVEFSTIRSVGEITSWTGLTRIGANQHYKSYDYSTAKSVAGVDGSSLITDTDLVSSNVDINKVM